MEEAYYDDGIENVRIVNVSEIAGLKDILLNNPEYTEATKRWYTCPECGNGVHYKAGIHPNFAHYPIESLSPENQEDQRVCNLWFVSSDIIIRKKEKIDIHKKIIDIQNILNENNIQGYIVLDYADLDKVNTLCENNKHNFIVVDKNKYIKEFWHKDNKFTYKKYKPKFLDRIEIFDKTTTVKNIFYNDRISIGTYLYTDGFYILKRYKDNNDYVTPYKITLDELKHLNELISSSSLSNIETYDKKIEEYNNKVKEFTDKITTYKNILNGESFTSKDILNEDEIILENKYNEELNKVTSRMIKDLTIKFDFNICGDIIMNVIKKYKSELEFDGKFVSFNYASGIYKGYDIIIDKLSDYHLQGKKGIWSNEKYIVKILTLENEFSGTKPTEITNPTLLRYDGERSALLDELMKYTNYFYKYKEENFESDIDKKSKEQINNSKQELYKNVINRKIKEETYKFEEYKHQNKMSKFESEIIKYLDVEEDYRKNLL